MNGTNSQGTYTKFFETFTQRGWCIANQNIFSLKDKKLNRRQFIKLVPIFLKNI